MKSEIGKPVKVIATGGLAVLFDNHPHMFDVVEPDLTLRGLAILFHQKNG
jgi:type III pantothenate kinase